MKKLFFFLAAMAMTFCLSAQDQFTVKDYATPEKHQRTINLANSILINSLSVAKKSGMSVEDFASQMGTNWATTWASDAGFSTLVNGQIWNMSSFLTEENPKIEILSQSDSEVKLKVFKNWKAMFSNGPIFGVTEAEMSSFWNIASQKIAGASWNYTNGRR